MEDGEMKDENGVPLSTKYYRGNKAREETMYGLFVELRDTVNADNSATIGKMKGELELLSLILTAVSVVSVVCLFFSFSLVI